LTARLILTGALLLARAAVGDTSNTDEGAVLVQAFVNDIVTLQGRFEQSLVDAKGDVVEVTSGTLRIQRPGQFRWSYTEPYEQVLVADGLNIWSYDVDLAQVTVKPQQQALANTPALLLGGSQDALDQFTIEGTRYDGDTTWVRMSPKHTESGFLRVELGFVNNTLSRMVFFDNLEQTTRVDLYDVEVNEPIDQAYFEFEAPIDVDVVGAPAVAKATVP